MLSLKRVRIMELTIDDLKEGGTEKPPRRSGRSWNEELQIPPSFPQPEGRTVYLYFQKNRGETAFPFLQFQKKKGKISQLLPALFQKNGSLSHRGSLLAVIITVKQEDIMENSLQRMKELVEKLDQPRRHITRKTGKS